MRRNFGLDSAYTVGTFLAPFFWVKQLCLPLVALPLDGPHVSASIVRCPTCAAQIRIPAGKSAGRIRCDKCDEVFEWTAKGAPRAAGPGSRDTHLPGRR